MKQTKPLLLILILASIILSCNSEPKTSSTDSTKTNDWIHLFDGTSTEGWRAYNGEELPPQWIIEDGA